MTLHDHPAGSALPIGAVPLSINEARLDAIAEFVESEDFTPLARDDARYLLRVIKRQHLALRIAEFNQIAVPVIPPESEPRGEGVLHVVPKAAASDDSMHRAARGGSVRSLRRASAGTRPAEIDR